MNLLDDYLGQGTSHGASEVSYDCPFCVERGHSPDNEEKLWVNYSKRLGDSKSVGVYYCYRCEAKGSLDYVFKWLGADIDAAPIDDEFVRILRILQGLEEPDAQQPEVVDRDYSAELIELGCRPVHPQGTAYQYLTERGVAPDDIAFYRMLEGRGRYHHRIIIPTFNFERRIPFFVARSMKQLYFTTEKGVVEAPKYLNPKGEGRKYSLFNLNHAVSADAIIVTEGVFSSIAAGRNAIATFGKLVTQTQVALLTAFAQGKEIIVCFDGDAHAQTANLAARLKDSGLRTSFVLLPEEHDPATLRAEDLQYLLRHRYPYSDTTVLRLQAEGVFRCRIEKQQSASDLSAVSPLQRSFASSVKWLQRASFTSPNVP